MSVNHSEALITNDAVVLGLLFGILAIVFKTQQMPRFKKFYTFVPGLLLCYFVPALFNSAGIISGEGSKLYFAASRYMLPAALVLLTLSIDFKKIIQLGPKALIMFFTGTLGVVIGGPLAILVTALFAPDWVGGHGPDAIWRGMTTVAGSWIGGGANQAAMKEVFEVSDGVFSAMIAVDVLVANVWMGFLLYGAARTQKMDAWFKSDTTAIVDLKEKVEAFQKEVAKMASFNDLIIIAAIGFGATGVSHLVADGVAPFVATHFAALAKFSLTSKFFWIIVTATTIGLLLSFTKAKNMEGAGASKVGSVFIYLLVATIGMKMDITAVFAQPGIFLVGFIWIAIHAVLLIIVGKLIRAPFFFLAVGSQANIGGAASAPVVASAFHTSLAPVGVLLAVLGYALGTYGAWICGLLMQFVAP